LNCKLVAPLINRNDGMKFSHRQHERKQQTIKSTLVVDRQVQTVFIPAITCTMPISQVSCLWFS